MCVAQDHPRRDPRLRCLEALIQRPRHCLPVNGSCAEAYLPWSVGIITIHLLRRLCKTFPLRRFMTVIAQALGPLVGHCNIGKTSSTLTGAILDPDRMCVPRQFPLRSDREDFPHHFSVSDIKATYSDEQPSSTEVSRTLFRSFHFPA